jgi:hypothetical protein
MSVPHVQSAALGSDPSHEAQPEGPTMTELSPPHEVRAIGTRTTNAEAIVDCVTLGYLGHDRITADVTYGLGGFWKLWRPSELVFFASDLDIARSPAGESIDFTALPYETASMDTVVFDPPYKLNGTSTEGSPSDERYGVDKTASIMQRHGLMLDGLTECIRVTKPGGFILAKCQDQVCSGKMQWQTHMMALHGGMIGARLRDSLFVQSYRPQPLGRVQKHARRDYSTLLIFEKG